MNFSTTGLKLAADSAVDLHLHTTYSDGRWTLKQLFDYLQQEKFALAAIADHDRADTAAAIQILAQETSLPILTAVEMSSTWRGEMVDLLCFGYDPSQTLLNGLAEDLLLRQEQNSREVYANLQRQGYTLPAEALSAILAEPNTQQSNALAALLIKHGYGLGDPPVGRILVEAGCAYALHDPAEVVDAAHRSGGVCLLAHPGRGDGFMTYDDSLLDQFRREAPIDGLEVYYPVHTPAQTGMYEAYARRNQLLLSAGSDSHGPEVPPIPYRAVQCRDLLGRVGIHVMQ